ncbi:altronate hydrolase [Geomicrobium sp. JCM 19037]|uniref:UxaA family hydrolase n=1 Tax=unclassified Geomicrobium TaxID=2628951 RepID=UPI00045F1008|nr:UxaA family hydrolase [Geomicrobium sp. JCM 19037]GAK05399.1 altronate hydrolase [Geomicrobium sp. JCM 19037]
MRTHVIMRPTDNVATAITTLNASDIVTIDGFDEVTILTNEGIDFGHKFAIVNINQGADIIKYGEVIGIASCAIQAGEHVHVHNVDGKRGRGDVNDELQTKRIQKN